MAGSQTTFTELIETCSEQKQTNNHNDKKWIYWEFVHMTCTDIFIKSGYNLFAND